MGRSGGGGGGHSGGSRGGSHHSSSHRSSFGGSSFRSSGSASHSSGYRGGYRSSSRGYRRSGYSSGYANGYAHGRATGHSRGYAGPSTPANPLGCISFLLVIGVIIAILIGITSANTASENDLAEYTQNQYKEIFGDREDCMLMVLMDDENGSCQITYGSKANGIMDRYINTIWDCYDANWNDDLGIQILGMFEDTIAVMRKNDNIKKIASEKGFDSNCYKDNLNWVDTKGNLVDGARAFYDETGIQSYFLFVKTKTVAKATNKSSGVFKVFIIALAAVAVLFILFTWWKKRVAQKNKEQEDLEKILSTPLESFGTTPIQDLASKYDDMPNNSPNNNPPNNNTPGNNQPSNNQPVNDTTSSNQPSNNQPVNDTTSNDTPGNNQQ